VIWCPGLWVRVVWCGSWGVRDVAVPIGCAAVPRARGCSGLGMGGCQRVHHPAFVWGGLGCVGVQRGWIDRPAGSAVAGGVWVGVFVRLG